MDKKERRRLYDRKRKIESRLSERAQKWEEEHDVYLDFDLDMKVGRLLEYVDLLEEQLKQADIDILQRNRDALDEWEELVKREF